MKARLIVSTMFFVFVFSSTYALEPDNNTSSLNVKAIENYLGKKGNNVEDNVYRILIPRNDLEIVLNGMKMTTDMGLTSRFEFKKSDEDDETRLSGDLILSQDQVNPVMSVVLNQGLEVTDLHNPFLWDSPHVMVMHIHGIGSETKLAKGVNKILYAMKATMHGQGDFPLVSLGETETDLNVMSINNILGARGIISGGAYKINFDYPKTNNSVGRAVAKNSWATFSGSNTDTLLDGTVAVKEAELQMVLRTLRNSQIYVLSIYQHNVDDDQNFVFVHYWGVGDSRKLARALRTTMQMAENHIEKNDNFFVEKNKVSSFLPQTACNQKPLAFTDNVVKKLNTALPYGKTTSIFEMLKSGIENILVKTEAKANYFLVNIAINWISSHVKQKPISSIEKVNIKPNVMPMVFYNSGLIEKHIANAFFWKVSSQNHQRFTYEKSYSYIAQLMNIHPVAFSIPEIPTFVTHQAVINNATLTHIIAITLGIKEIKQNTLMLQTENKNYNYLLQIQKMYPVNFRKEELVAPTSVITKDFHNNAKIISALENTLGIKHLTHNALTLHVENKNYNYLDHISKMNAVLFLTEKTSVVPTQIIVADFHNSAKIMSALENILGIKHVPNNFILRAENKNYNYIQLLQESHPVAFQSQIYPHTIVATGVRVTAPKVQKTISRTALDFHNAVPKPLVMNSFHNEDKLAKALLSAFRNKQDKQDKQDKSESSILGQVSRAVAQNKYQPFLLAENNKSTLPAPISEMASNIKSDISQTVPGNIIPIKTPVTKASILKSYPEEVIIQEKIKPVKIAFHRKHVMLAEGVSQNITKELNAKINNQFPIKKSKSTCCTTSKQDVAAHVSHRSIPFQRTELKKQKSMHRMVLKKRQPIISHLVLHKQKQKPIHHVVLKMQKIVKHSYPIPMMAKQESKLHLPSHVKIEENAMPFDGISD